VKLVHLVGFITKKFVTTHGHMNVKYGKQHFLSLFLRYPVIYIVINKNKTLNRHNKDNVAGKEQQNEELGKKS
jgi:hypothetical protein